VSAPGRSAVSDQSNARLDYPIDLREAVAIWGRCHAAARSPQRRTWDRQFLR
jgi:hypothetical protein